MRFFYALRYFHVVSVVPALFVAGFAVTVAAAAIRLTSDPSSAVDALTPVLLLQLFAASSGFRVAARRGHYDLLLTSGASRHEIALAHCLATVLPGLVAWTCVALLEAAASHGSSLRAAAAGSVVAFLGTSFLAWAAAIPLSRATAAMVWLLIMTIPPVARIASPVQWLGTTPAHSMLALLVMGVVVAAEVAMACAWIARMSIPLEGSQ